MRRRMMLVKGEAGACEEEDDACERGGWCL